MDTQDYSATGVLKAIRQSYSQLTAALALASGLCAKVVAGIGGTKNISTALAKDPQHLEKFANHAWNEVLCDGKWVTSDTTWDALGVCNHRFW